MVLYRVYDNPLDMTGLHSFISTRLSKTGIDDDAVPQLRFMAPTVIAINECDHHKLLNNDYYEMIHEKMTQKAHIS